MGYGANLGLRLSPAGADVLHSIQSHCDRGLYRPVKRRAGGWRSWTSGARSVAKPGSVYRRQSIASATRADDDSIRPNSKWNRSMRRPRLHVASDARRRASNHSKSIAGVQLHVAPKHKRRTRTVILRRNFRSTKHLSPVDLHSQYSAASLRLVNHIINGLTIVKRQRTQ